MTEYLLLLVGTVLINNFVLVKFLGLCPFMGVSGKLETAIGMGLATTFVMTLASACSYLMEHYILIPLDIAYLRTLGFILVIAVVVQFTEMVIPRAARPSIACSASSCRSSPPTVPCSAWRCSASTSATTSSRASSTASGPPSASPWC
jgi:electron transport complex protein RnfA